MGKAFSSLTEDKQNAIINAGLQVFSKESYRNALTEDVARLAGISKGLLFYYFKNKKEFYVFLYDYGTNFIVEHMMDKSEMKTRDFFELLEASVRCKQEIYRNHPYLYPFIIRAYYEEQEDIKQSISMENMKRMAETEQNILAYLDFSKFKEHIDPMKIYQLIAWACEGYMKECMAKGMQSVDEIGNQFMEYFTLLKLGFYKEEYL